MSFQRLRYSISVSNSVYDKLLTHCKANSLSMSGVVEWESRRFLGLPPREDSPRSSSSATRRAKPREKLPPVVKARPPRAPVAPKDLKIAANNKSLLDESGNLIIVENRKEAFMWNAIRGVPKPAEGLYRESRQAGHFNRYVRKGEPRQIKFDIHIEPAEGWVNGVEGAYPVKAKPPAPPKRAKAGRPPKVIRPVIHVELPPDEPYCALGPLPGHDRSLLDQIAEIHRADLRSRLARDQIDKINRPKIDKAPRTSPPPRLHVESAKGTRDERDVVMPKVAAKIFTF